MENFEDLDSLYAHLESNSLNYKYPNEIAQLFQIIRDKYKEEKRNDLVEKAQLEMDAFNFTLRDGKLEPFYEILNENGDFIEYPNFSNYSDLSFIHIEERLGQSINPLLKSRYAHILWNSPKKHNKYAIIALSSYLDLIDLYKNKFMESGMYEKELVELIKNAYFISRNIKDHSKISIIKIKIHSLIPIFDLKRRFYFEMWVPLVELMLKERDIFNKDDFVGIDSLCFIAGDYLKRIQNLNYAIFIFELGERVEARSGCKTYTWRKYIAECNEILMYQAKDGLVALNFCHSAIDNYRRIKDNQKVNQLEEKLKELKSSLELRCTKYDVDISDYLKYCSDLSEELLGKGAEYAIGFLMNYSDLLPKYCDLESLAKDLMKKYPLITVFSTVILDDRGHTSEHISTEDEHKYNQILFNYNLAIKMKTLPLLDTLILKSIQEGKFNVITFIDFFKNHSWYGKTINKKLPNGNFQIYNWLNFLIPSINEYFVQINQYFISGSIPNFILASDSLTLKLEGLIRDLCDINGLITFYQTKDKKGRIITREKDVNMLLHEEKIKTILDEDDLLFFKYLLIEKAGLNFRHKIAHSLIGYNEYNLDIMNLLILGLLRLGRYDFSDNVHD